MLRALAAQTVEHELLVCDSGSSDGSAELARRSGARARDRPRGVQPRRHAQPARGGVRLAEWRSSHRTQNQPTRAGSSACSRASRSRPTWGSSTVPTSPRRCLAGGADRAGALVRLARSRRPPTLERLAEPERLRVPRPRSSAAGASSPTPTPACRARLAASTVPAGGICRGPHARDRHDACRLRQGLPARRQRSCTPTTTRPRRAEARLRRVARAAGGLRLARAGRCPAAARRCVASSDTPGRELQEEICPLPRRAGALGGAAHRLARLAGALLGSRADDCPPARHLSLERRAEFEPLGLDGPRRRPIEPMSDQTPRSGARRRSPRRRRSRRPLDQFSGPLPACADVPHLRYLGWRTLLFRILTFPLRFTPLGRRLRLRSPRPGRDAARCVVSRARRRSTS